MNQPESNALPPAVAGLGYGGLTPFLGLLLLIHVLPWQHTLLTFTLLAYGAVILSFVGAVHWGFAMVLPELAQAQRQAAYLWSIVPALIAWPALLLDPRWGALVLVTGFLLHYRQDTRLAEQCTLPGWYLPLRLRLTCVASLCLLGSIAL